MSLSAGIAALGAAGLIYCGTITANLRRHTATYAPVREDWIFNVVLPFIVYGGFLGCGYWIWREPRDALYGIAAFSLILLFNGIRNAWDIAVWMTTATPKKPSS